MATLNDVQLQPPSPTGDLLADLRTLIDAAHSQAVQAVNTTLVRLYWSIGRRIDGDVLRDSRAEYGQQIVATLSRQLTVEYGSGFSEKNLRRMVQMARAFPDEQIVVTLSRQLSWSHFVALIPLRDPLKRDFYAEMCRVERWSVRMLRAKLDGMLFERTALSKKPEELVRRELDRLRDDDELSPDLVFQDPYLLDFLGLKGAYSEKDLEAAILRELESFLLELGTGFTSDRTHPLCGEISRACRAFAAGGQRHPRRGVHDGVASSGCFGEETPRCHPGGPFGDCRPQDRPRACRATRRAKTKNDKDRNRMMGAAYPGWGGALRAYPGLCH